MAVISVVTIATPPQEATVSEMERVPEKWKIAVIEDNIYFSKEDEDKLKRDILGFFKQAGSPSHSSLRDFFNCMVFVFGFSLIGFSREHWLQRNKQRA